MARVERLLSPPDNLSFYVTFAFACGDEATRSGAPPDRPAPQLPGCAVPRVVGCRPCRTRAGWRRAAGGSPPSPVARRRRTTSCRLPFDAAVMLWDLRAAVPLATITRHSDKVRPAPPSWPGRPRPQCGGRVAERRSGWGKRGHTARRGRQTHLHSFSFYPEHLKKCNEAQIDRTEAADRPTAPPHRHRHHPAHFAACRHPVPAS